LLLFDDKWNGQVLLSLSAGLNKKAVARLRSGNTITGEPGNAILLMTDHRDET